MIGAVVEGCVVRENRGMIAGFAMLSESAGLDHGYLATNT